jgi:hypothetical protein
MISKRGISRGFVIETKKESLFKSATTAIDPTKKKKAINGLTNFDFFNHALFFFITNNCFIFKKLN